MKTVSVQDAVGKVLGHDITQIVPGFFMGHAGFCANCPDCRYPHCPFGKMGRFQY
jgi:hypothetical protein